MRSTGLPATFTEPEEVAGLPSTPFVATRSGPGRASPTSATVRRSSGRHRSIARGPKRSSLAAHRIPISGGRRATCSVRSPTRCHWRGRPRILCGRGAVNTAAGHCSSLKGVPPRSDRRAPRAHDDRLDHLLHPRSRRSSHRGIPAARPRRRRASPLTSRAIPLRDGSGERRRRKGWREGAERIEVWCRRSIVLTIPLPTACARTRRRILSVDRSDEAVDVAEVLAYLAVGRAGELAAIPIEGPRRRRARSCNRCEAEVVADCDSPRARHELSLLRKELRGELRRVLRVPCASTEQ